MSSTGTERDTTSWTGEYSASWRSNSAGARAATSHWGYERLFRNSYPAVDFKAAPVLQFADPEGRIATAGGTTSWHDLALHIIARHCSPGEALRIAKVYLLKTHEEGQLPYASLVQAAPHADSLARECEKLLKDIFRGDAPVTRLVAQLRVPERTLKRRFKAATGSSLLDYVQNLRIEEAKRLLESSDTPVDEISAIVGYDNASFFRRLFKRRCGLSPAQYRQLFSSSAFARTGRPLPADHDRHRLEVDLRPHREDPKDSRAAGSRLGDRL